MRTPQPYSRRELRQRRKVWRHRNAKVVVVGAALLLILGASVTLLAAWWPGPMSSTSWYVLGATHAALVGIVLHLLESAFLVHDRDAMRHVRGAWGEDNTRSELVSARRRRLIWGWVDSIDTAGGDLDHLVVTRRGGLVVLDSKFRTHVDSAQATEMARVARRARLRAEGVAKTALGSSQWGKRRARTTTVRVRVVVVLWGSAQATLPAGGAVVDEVQFIAGRELRTYLLGLDGDVVSREVAEDLLDRLADFRRTTAATAQTRVRAR